MPEGLMGACVLPAEDLRTSLYIEGNDVGGGEKWKAQGRWNWEGEMNGTSSTRGGAAFERGRGLFICRNKRKDKEDGFRAASFQNGNLRVSI